MKFFCTLALLVLGLAPHAQTPTISSTYGITGECTGVVYGNGEYVAAANLTTGLWAVFTSIDAKTWTPVPFGHIPATGFSLLAFGNGIFAAVSGPSTIYSSTNGTDWTLRASDIPGGITDLKFIQGAFYAISSSDIYRSTDGINWTPFSPGITIPSGTSYLSIEYGGGQYVIAASVGPSVKYGTTSTAILRSLTGEPGSWTFTDLNGYSSFTKLTWLKDRFYLFAGGGFVTSTDALSWTGPTAPLTDTLTDGTIGTLTELDAPAAFAAGDSVYLMGANYGNGTYSMQVSNDQAHFKAFYSSGMRALGGLYVNALYIIYGDGGISTSTDGIHFRTNSTSFTGLTSNGSGFVAVGGGHMFSSPDFVSWTDQTPDTDGLPIINTLLYTGTRYMAAGSDGSGGGRIYFSADGASWSNIQTPYNFLCMTYGAGRFVAGSTDNPDYMLTGSADGISWSVVDTNYTYYYKVRYINNAFFAMGISYRDLTGRIMHSADGLHWENITPTAGFAVSHYNDVLYDGTKYYFPGMKKYPDGSIRDFFTLSTTNPMDTMSYGAAGSIVNPAPGTTAADYIVQFADFVYHNGQFVGTAEDRVNSQAYLVYSADGTNWTTTPLNGPEQPRTILVDGDVYRIVGDDGGRYTVGFSGTLPITLFDFQAVAVGSATSENSRLSWQTASESNSAYFLVQHSLDAVHWDSIGKVTAAGETQSTMAYQFTQTAPPAGANYYRLGLTDRDGQRQWSPVRKVDIGSQQSVRLYPNPAKDMVQLQLPGSGPASLVIYNSAGLPVQQQIVTGYSVTLDLRSLTAGTYHLMVFQSGKRYTKEFIVAD
jgi:hypothetical protein